MLCHADVPSPVPLLSAPLHLPLRRFQPLLHTPTGYRRREDPDCSGGLAPAPRVHHRQRRGRLAAPDGALLFSPCVHAILETLSPSSLRLSSISLFLSVCLRLGRPPLSRSSLLSPLSFSLSFSLLSRFAAALPVSFSREPLTLLNVKKHRDFIIPFN